MAGEGGNVPKLPGSGGGGGNPLRKKELDILDPEAKPKDNEKKGIGDIVKGIKKAFDKVKRIIDIIKMIPPPALPWVILIILAIFIITGFIGFFTLMPGLVINAIKDFAQGAIDTVESWFTTNADAYINEDDIVDLANYLEEMEYDLIGYGFIVPNSNYSIDTGTLTVDQLKELGYIYFEKRGDDENARYYSQSAEEDPNGTSAYSGLYYNSLGILMDNDTGTMVEGEYIDQYGIERSTEETNSSGEGKIISFGEDFASLGLLGVAADAILDWTVDTKLLRSYLLSDYKIYAIRNDDEGLLADVFTAIKKTFGGYDSAWSKGLLKFFYASNATADGEWVSSLPHTLVYGDDISISRTSTGGKMTVRNGYFNNPINFVIDGWADRYGMSLEFLLSLHIATMQPDLVYAMLQSFDTEVQVYLEDSGDADVEAAYLDMLNPDVELGSDEDMITFADAKEILESHGGFDLNDWLMNDTYLLSGLSGLAISKADAQYLLDELPLESPPNCTGQAEVDIILKTTYKDPAWYRWDNLITLYNIDETDLGDEANSLDETNRDIETDEGEYTDFDAHNCTYEIASDGTSLDEVIDTGYGYSDTVENIIDDENFMFFKSVGETLGYDEETAEIDVETEVTEDVNPIGDGRVFDIYGTKTTRTWTTTATDVDGNEVLDEDGETEEVEYEWITYKFVVYYVGANASILPGYTETDERLFSIVVWEYITRDKTYEELVACGAIDENGEETPRSQVCSAVNHDEDSSNDQEKCCKNCQKYVKKVIKALAQVNDSNYASYTPYIARVLGSWFRDTYFVIPEEPDSAITNYINEVDNRTESELDMINNSWGESELVIVDEEYLAETEEYWTAYEMNEDESDYQLYYLNPNGTTSDIKMEDFLETNGYSSQEEAEEDGHAFVKKAKTTTVSQLNSYVNDDPDADVVLWSAYEFNSDGAATGWIKIEYEDDNEEVNNVYDVTSLAEGEDYYNEEGGFYYNLSTTNSVTQVEDAQRSQTNPTVKWLFKYRKYYTYDGTDETALLISEDREAVLTCVKQYLYDTYNGSSAPSTIARKLANYGRSALRQAYSNSTITFEWDDIAEEWLDWQLDMYYSGIIECDESDYKLDGLAFIATTDDDGNLESITYTTNLDYTAGENEELRVGDPRNPDLISTTNITKTSLEAFTILENTKTLAAEYAYRDFKELIVELDYFDKEDLSDAVEEVFTWVIPELTPTGWPVRPWDKQDEDYGALIESAGTYDYLEEIDYDVSDSDEDGDDENADAEDNEEEDTDEDTSTNETVDIAKLQFVGDSWIDGLSAQDVAESTYFYGVTGASAASSEMSIDNITVQSDASGIVLYLGVNNTSSASQMNSLIDELISRYNIPVYVVKVNHVGTAYTTIDASTMNSNIDSYNSSVQSHCSSTEGAYFIDATTGLQDSDGYLISSYTSDGLHLNSQAAYQTWYNNIISGINGATGSSASETFEGYVGGEYVSSPVTGKVLEYGVHNRTNVYTGEIEEVGYIVIQAISAEDWFTADNITNNSGDTEGIDDATIATGLNLFYNEYEETCAGFTITIDGFKVDLNTTDDEGNNGTYEQNEVATLYNSSEQAIREEQEQQKDDAPFFVNMGESADLGSLPETYECSLDDSDTGYYIKEGKYIGVTYTDDEASALVISTDESSTETATDEEYTGPANYMRIIVKDREYSIIDNVEDYFDIPDPDSGTSSTIYPGNTVEEMVWNALIQAGYSEIATAAAMGNIYQESGFQTNNLQNSYEISLGYSDDSYTAAVDSGAYSESSFVNDSAGYGLIQWTSSGRKQALYSLAKQKGVSIADANMQIEEMLIELAGNWSSGDGNADKEVWMYSTDLNTATDAYCDGFEGAGTPNYEARREAAQRYLDQYGSGS